MGLKNLPLELLQIELRNRPPERHPAWCDSDSSSKLLTVTGGETEPEFAMHAHLCRMDIAAFALRLAQCINTLKHVNISFLWGQQADRSWRVVRSPDGEVDLVLEEDPDDE